MRILGGGDDTLRGIAEEQQAEHPTPERQPVTVFVDPDKEPSWFWAACAASLAIAAIFALLFVEG